MDIRREFQSQYSERYRLAADAHARAEGEAIKLEKMTKRVFASLVHHGTGSVNAREYAARCDPKYTAIEDEWINAQTTATLLKTKVDAVEIEFKEFQSVNANRRAEAGIR